MNIGKGTLKIGGKLLLKLLKAINAKHQENTVGKRVSTKKLTKEGGSLESQKITNSNIGRFKHSARKFGVKFSLEKDIVTGERYLCFSAKNKEAMSLAVNDFYQRDAKYRKSAVFKGKEKIKSSILGKVNLYKKQIKENFDFGIGKEKRRNKGEMTI